VHRLHQRERTGAIARDWTAGKREAPQLVGRASPGYGVKERRRRATLRRGLPELSEANGRAGYGCDDAARFVARSKAGGERRKQPFRGGLQGWHARCSQHIANV
jgi:hypothetical protein